VQLICLARSIAESSPVHQKILEHLCYGSFAYASSSIQDNLHKMTHFSQKKKGADALQHAGEPLGLSQTTRWRGREEGGTK
jgi:hypothetical protein